MTELAGPDSDNAMLSAADVQAANFLDRTMLPMAALSLQGTVLIANDALCRLLGAPRDALVGRPATELCHRPSDREVTQSALSAAAAGETNGRLALELQAADQRVLPVRVNWTLGADEASYVMAVYIHDPQRGRAELALAASEARWRALLAHAADITWTADSDGLVLSVTSASPGNLRWQLEAALGRAAVDFVHGDDQPGFRTAWERLLSGARQEVQECRIRRNDGTWTWVRKTLTDLRNDPHVRAVVGTVVDISDQRRQEDRTRETARRRARFDQSRIPQARLDLTGALTAANPAFCGLLGRPWKALEGQLFSALSHTDDDGLADEVLAVVLSGTAESAQALRTLVGDDGHPVPVSIGLTLLREAGSPSGVAAFVYDQTAQRASERRRDQQEQFFAAIGRLSSGLAVVGDVDGQLVYVSPAVTTQFGYSVAEMLNVDGWDFMHPDDVETARSAYQEVVSQGGTRTLLLRLRAGDNDWRWVEETAINMLDNAIGGIVCMLRDVTERVHTERALRKSEARYRNFADAAEEGIWAIDSSGRTLYANARMATIVGLSLSQLYDLPATSILDPGAEQSLSQKEAERAQRGTERYEIGYEHPDQSERRLWIVATPLPDVDGDVEGSLSMISDVTDLRRDEQEVLRAAQHDPLTGLPNRSLLLDRLDEALEHAPEATAVLWLDLDRFKFVNDSRGHAFGDQLLVAVAERLLSSARPSDTVARFTGDEFVIVCEGVDEPQAQEVAASLLAALSEPFQVDDAVIHVDASVGVAITPPASSSDLLRYADTAMHSAKSAGRGRIRLFDRALNEQAEQRYALAADLRIAFAGDELSMHYQPVIDLKSGRVCGLEALARWMHPVHGFIPPDRFVPLAEMSGMAAELDRWAMGRALRDTNTFRTEQVLPLDAYVAVNLSAANLAQPRLEDLIVASADTAGMSPGRVVLEITESAIMNDTELAISLLRRLRARGFQVAVDDFGTGYSSLAYLRDLPITHLKIDRSFVTDIAHDPDALAVVGSIVDLARAVGIIAVAEGVETAEQAALLRHLGCPTAQGWLWSRAQPPHEIRSAGTGTRTYEVPNRDIPIPLRRGELQVDPAHGLHRLLALHRKGASLVTIAATLNLEGYSTPGGLRWHETSVARAVADTAYPSVAEG